eukprot:6342014-Prymnesium_polylepis.1
MGRLVTIPCAGASAFPGPDSRFTTYVSKPSLSGMRRAFRNVPLLAFVDQASSASDLEFRRMMQDTASTHQCVCPENFPLCWSGDQYCYASASSSDYSPI